MIEELKPEICCFQECNKKTSRSGDTPIQEILKPTYIEALPEKADENYTPIFYNPNMVEFIEGGYFPFEGLNGDGSKSVTWVLFKEKLTDKKVIIMSVHFWYMAESEKDNLQRQENAKVVANLAKKLNEVHNVPVLVAGDLNSGDTDQGTGGYDKMVELGMNDIRFLAKETDNAKTCSSDYPAMREDGIYENSAMPDCTIDYIFVYEAAPINANKFFVFNTQKARNSSDHLPLILDFDI